MNITQIKHKLLQSLLIFFAFLVISPTAVSAQGAIEKVRQIKNATEIQTKLSEEDIHPSRFAVIYKEGVTTEHIGQTNLSLSGIKQRVMKPKYGGKIIQSITITEGQSMEDEMLKYASDPAVESVEVIHKGHLTWDDTLETDKTFSDDFDDFPTRDTGYHWYYYKTKLPEVWDDQDCVGAGAECGGDSSITVAVIDTGVAYEDYTADFDYTLREPPETYTDYPPIDFDPADEIANCSDPTYVNESDCTSHGETWNTINIYTNDGDPYGDDLGDDNSDDDGNGICDDYHGFDAEMWIDNYLTSWDCDGSPATDSQKEGHANDDFGHGTYVAGIIASLTDNGSGSVSSAHQTTIMPIKVNPPFSGNVWEDAFYYATVYAVDMGADVINVSLGWCSPSTVFLQSAVDYAEAANVPMVVASGNSGNCGRFTPLLYPAAFSDPNVIAVGAIDIDDDRSNYSVYGSGLDLVAPVGSGSGYSNSTRQQTLNCAWSCDETDDYTNFKLMSGNGTSFATPQVSAAVALIKSRDNSLSPEKITATLRSTATDITAYGTGWDQETGYGNLNLESVWENIWTDFSHNGIQTNNAITTKEYGGNLYQCFTGYSSDLIYCRYFDGASWSSHVNVGGVKTKNAVALEVYDGNLYQCFTGYSSDLVYCRYFDGASWSQHVNVGGVKTKNAVALETYGGNLYQCFTGYSSDRVYCRYFDGASWSSHTTTGIKTKNAVALEVYDGNLYQCFTGYSSDLVYYRYFDGASWSSHTATGVRTSNAVALMDFNSRLYQSFTGYTSSLIYNRYYDGSSWSNHIRRVEQTKTAPNLNSYNSTLYQFFTGYSSDLVYEGTKY